MKNIIQLRILTAAISIGCSVTIIAAPAIANSPTNLTELTEEELIQIQIESDKSERIALSSRLRTLSQQVAAASCALTSGVSQEQAHEVLNQSSINFVRYLGALRDGDPDLGIMSAETNRGILADLDAIVAEWGTIEESVASVLSDWNDVEASHVIDDHNAALLELTNKLAADVAGVHANAFAMSARDAMKLELAGRQLMLTQQMAKYSCEIWSGYNADYARERLGDTMQIFEASLTALRHGMPSAGISPAPTEEIAADLDRLLERWSILKVNQQALLDGQTLTEEQKSEIFVDLQHELDDLRLLLLHYSEFAERNQS